MSDIIKCEVGSLKFNDEVVISCVLDPDLSKDYFNRIVGMADGASKSSKDLAFGWLHSRIDDETANFTEAAAKMGFSDQVTIFAFEDGSYKQVDVTDGVITSADVYAATAGMPALTAVYGGDVVSVETSAFCMQQDLRTALFPKTTYVGECGFVLCGKLDVVDFPALSACGLRAFGAIGAAAVDMPDLVSSDGGQAFLQCGNLKYVDMPNLAGIDQYFFYGCPRLEDVSLGVLSVCSQNFGGYRSLKRVSLANAVYVDYYAFVGCSSLEQVDMPEVSSINYYAFLNCVSLTAADFPKLQKLGGSVYGLFSGCVNLKSAYVPKLEMIGVEMFKGCERLESVTAPAATGMANDSFAGCTSLRSVSLPKMQNVSENAFADCVSLTQVAMPSMIHKIDRHSFQNCQSLTEAYFPKAKYIREGAFAGCTALRSAYVPAISAWYGSGDSNISVQNNNLVIGISAFSGCSQLTSVECSANTSYAPDAFAGAPWSPSWSPTDPQ